MILIKEQRSLIPKCTVTQVQRLFNFLHLLRNSPFIFIYAFLFKLIAKYFELGQIYAKLSDVLAICCRTGKGNA